MDVLVTGGAGYIGSTVASALADAGHRPVLLDDLSTGRPDFLRRHAFYVGDVADRRLVRLVLAENPDIRVVVHCAARVVVPESVADPATYYDTNITGTLQLVRTLLECDVTRLVFSGSAAIYEAGADFTVHEDSAWRPVSPYARTKAVAEWMLADLAAATDLRAMSLRYFNPIGADPALRTGSPQPAPSHVLGRLISAQVSGTPFRITGTDYPTPDGTGIRDYVHVWDLARAHVAAVERFDAALDGTRCTAINVGTGRGTSVRELVAAFGRVTGRPVPTVDAPRRAGDVAGAHAQVDRAAERLGWRAALGLDDAIRDALAWTRANRTHRPAAVLVANGGRST